MPDLLAKANALGRAAQYDLCSSCGTSATRVRDDIGRWIYPAIMPDGRRVQLFKVLLTNVCERDCGYCANRSCSGAWPPGCFSARPCVIPPNAPWSA